MKPKQRFRRRAAPAEVPFLWNEFDLPALRRDLRCNERQRVFQELNEGASIRIGGQDHLACNFWRVLFAPPQSLALTKLPAWFGQVDRGKIRASSAADET